MLWSDNNWGHVRHCTNVGYYSLWLYCTLGRARDSRLSSVLAKKQIWGAFPIPSEASSYVEKLGKRFFAHRYFLENLAARFSIVAQAGGAIFASFTVLGLLASLAHRKCTKCGECDSNARQVCVCVCVCVCVRACVRAECKWLRAKYDVNNYFSSLYYEREPCIAIDEL